ncbi:MAG: hypothetical protein D6730_22720 [Bacteroidetes bacterium]|nr:MAG: hypothetical protein D6730_22720 [Bacteroidota bacterium]
MRFLTTQRFFVIACLLMFMANTYLGYLLYGTKRFRADCLLTIRQNEQIVNQLSQAKQLINEILASSGDSIRPSTTIKDKEGHTLKLSQLVQDGTKLIFVSPQHACGTCVARELENLNELSQHIGAEHILIFGTFENIRELTLFQQYNNIQPNVYKLDQQLGFELEKLQSTPFMFLLDQRMEVKKFFIPSPAFPELSTNYYQMIRTGYFQPSPTVHQ